MAVGNLSKNGPSSGNCNTPDRLVVSDTEVHHSESVPLGQMCNLVGMMNDHSVKNSNNWMVPMGKGCIWVGCPNKVVVAVAVAAAADKSAAAAACVVHPAWLADIRCC